MAKTELDAAATTRYAAGAQANMATFTAGTVLTASGQSADTAGAGSSERIASFEPAYKITALPDWLFEQTPSASARRLGRPGRCESPAQQATNRSPTWARLSTPRRHSVRGPRRPAMEWRRAVEDARTPCRRRGLSA